MIAEPKSPFPRRVDHTLLGRLSKPMGSPGQCLAVYRLLDHPGWLYKQYRPDQLRAADELRLSRLISLPDKLTAADRRLLLGHTCWSQTQVLDGRLTSGVVFPEAPAHYFARLRVPGGTRERTALLLTQLASDEDAFERVGLTPPTIAQRLTACAGLIEVGDLLERHGLVYGDWGYKNVFWSERDYSVYFIDVDACSFGPQPWVQSHGFTDPFTPDGVPVDTYTERFRCAIAVAACLTGSRAPQKAIPALEQLSGDERIHRLVPILMQIVGSAARSERLPIGELRKALSSPAATSSTTTTHSVTPVLSDGANIEGWVPVAPKPPQSRTPPRNQTPPTRRPGSSAPYPGAAPPEYHPPKPAATTPPSGGAGSPSSTGTTPLVTPQRGPSYPATPQRTTSTTRMTNGGSAARTLSSAAVDRHQKRRRRNTLVVSLLLLLAIAGITSLLVAVL